MIYTDISNIVSSFATRARILILIEMYQFHFDFTTLQVMKRHCNISSYIVHHQMIREIDLGLIGTKTTAFESWPYVAYKRL